MLALKQLYEARTPAGKVQPSFGFPHFFLALLTLEMHGKMGRTELVQVLGLGRASVQTLLTRMKLEPALVVAESTKAHTLTPMGKTLVSDAKKGFYLIGNLASTLPEFTLGDTNAVGKLSIPDHFKQRTIAMDPFVLRDAAIREGASGLSSFIVEGNRKVKLLSTDMDVKRRFTEGWERMNEIFPLEGCKGDLLLVASAGSLHAAKRAVIASAARALEMLQKGEEKRGNYTS